MAFQLSDNMFRELARARLLPRMGRERVQEFFTPFEAAPLPDWYETLFRPTQVGHAAEVPYTTASDNWVVDGKHSVTGKPLLANDPHLRFGIPSLWYLAHLSFGGEEAVGGTLPGVPGIIVGRTRRLAWGFTNVGPDTQDLYIERINPTNPNEYQTPTGWSRFETRVERIRVRFGGEKAIMVRSTRHGPVMPEIEPFDGVAPKGYVLALAWTALAPDDTTVEVTFGLNRAQSAVELNGLAGRFITPMQNMVYADAGGTIGLVLPGRVPIRSANNDARGLVPAPGWEAQYDWQGFVPLSAQPKIENPPIGYLGTANNDTLPPGYPYTFSYEWESIYRYDRIMQLLAATPRHTLETFKAMQMDPVDRYAVTLIRYLRDVPLQDRAAEAARLLERWDGAMRRDRPEPLIYAAWARALAKRIYGDDLGDDLDANWNYRSEFTLRVLSGTPDPGYARWCDDRKTDGVETCAVQLAAALADALAELTGAYGEDIAAWRWGDAHRAVHGSSPLSDAPLIGGFFGREVETDGGYHTLLRQAGRMASPRPYASVHGGAYRAVYDLANPEASQFIISTGQSGNAFSPHYDDLLPLWASGRYITIPARPAVTVGITELRPKSAASAQQTAANYAR
jgi:penicillin amidase